MIRRFKSQVLAELPDKQYTVIEVESDANVKMLEEQIMGYVDREALDTLLHADKEDSKAKSMTFFNIFGEQQPFELISKFRHAAAIAKLSTVIEYTQELLEETDKVIVFAHHKVIQEALLQKFENAAYIRGGMPNDERQVQVDKFQDDPNCHVFVGSLKAASEGITLTAASEVVMAEIDWTPAAMQQAEDRAHRIGQKDMVNVHMLITGGIEGWIAQLVAEKEEIIEASVGADSEAMDPRLDELKGKMQALHKHLEKAKEVALEQARVDAEQAKMKKAKMAAEYAEYGITDEKMETAQAMCRYLASVCDGAAAEDGQGFNKFDSQFGKDLAAKDFWTVKMYLAVTKMMRKYKGQLPAHQYEVVYGG
jgi:superfamily II DNA/RNA helicase